jgi:FdhD protein
MSNIDLSTKGVRIQRRAKDESVVVEDLLAVEEPLEIRLAYRGKQGVLASRGISITMRTPGADEELAAGFLATEGIVSSSSDIEEISIGSGEDKSGLGLAPNIARVVLREGVVVDFEQLSRHVFTSSSCGVCGKATLEALSVRGLKAIEEDGFRITSNILRSLPDKLLEFQQTFARTGGLHATALVDPSGKIIDVAEDVGRHNAMDKLLGRCFLSGEWPLSKHFILVSGRASFELVQKALLAGVPMLAAVGAPSSLAVELADSFGMTLAGFLSDKRFNIYCRPERIEDN